MTREADSGGSVQRSVALAYSGVGAPVLVAKGDGELARQIMAKAREHGIPLVQDEPLTELLSRLTLGEEIPPRLYVVVAEVLAFVYRLNAQFDDTA